TASRDIFIDTARIPAHDAAAGIADKGNDLVPLVAHRDVRLDDAQRLAHVIAAYIKNAVNVEDVVDLVGRIAPALQADAVHAYIRQRLAGGLYIRRHVLAHERAPGDERMGADPHELLHGGQAGEHDVIAYGDMTGK